MEQNSKEPTLDAVAPGDDISDEWTMMDISSPGNKCQSSIYFSTTYTISLLIHNKSRTQYQLFS